MPWAGVPGTLCAWGHCMSSGCSTLLQDRAHQMAQDCPLVMFPSTRQNKCTKMQFGNGSKSLQTYSFGMVPKDVAKCVRHLCSLHFGRTSRLKCTFSLFLNSPLLMFPSSPLLMFPSISENQFQNNKNGLFWNHSKTVRFWNFGIGFGAPN